jgi:hypothetical protein
VSLVRATDSEASRRTRRVRRGQRTPRIARASARRFANGAWTLEFDREGEGIGAKLTLNRAIGAEIRTCDPAARRAGRQDGRK